MPDRRFVLVAILSIFSGLANAAAAPCDSHQYYDEIMAKVGGLDGGVAAWFMLRASEKSHADACSREMLVRQAFDRAAGAAELSWIFVGGPDSSAEMLLNNSGNIALDRVAIQLLAVDAMLGISEDQGSDLLKQVKPAIYKRGSCGTDLVADPRPSWSGLKRALPRLTYVDRIDTLARFFEGLSTSPEIAEAADILTSLELAPQDRAAFAASLESIIAKADDGDPDFTAAVIYYQLPSVISKLANSGISAKGLVETYRTFLTTNSGMRCDSLDSVSRLNKTMPGRNYTEMFNDMIAELSAIGKISPDSIAPLPVRPASTAKDHTQAFRTRLYNSGDSAHLSKELQRVLADLGSLDEDDPKLASEVDAFLGDLKAYGDKVDPGNHAEILGEVGEMYRNLLEAIKPRWEVRVTEEYAFLLGRGCQTVDVDSACLRFFSLLIAPGRQDTQGHVESHFSRIRKNAALDGISGGNPRAKAILELTIDFAEEAGDAKH